MSVEEQLDMIIAMMKALQASSQVPEFYSIKDAAKVVGVSADHIRRAVVGGVLSVSNVGTLARPTYRIARADLLSWMETRKAGAIPPASRKGSVTPPSRHHHGHSAGHDS